MAEPALSAVDIRVRFGGVRAVDGVSFELPADGVLGLIGPNGSGKSTLLNALTGQVRADGRARVHGEDLPLGRPGEVRRRGVLRAFQTAQTFGELTCLENVLLTAPDRSLSGLGGAWFRRRAMLARERERWHAATANLERVGLAGLADRPASMLTYGQHRLLELARCLAGEPSVLLLDEPSAGLNATETDTLAALLESVRDEGVAILLVDHKVDFVDRICDHLIVLELGRVIAEGPPEVVWADEAVIDAYLGASHE